MIVHEIVGTEAHPVYQELQVSNGTRQYDFLRSAVTASLGLQRDFLSLEIIRSLNFHAITCLHVNAGEFRPCTVVVGQPPNAYSPPAPFQVQAQMEDFVNQVNRNWSEADPIALAAFVIWRLNAIHPFINGNGRTARALSLFVLCLKFNAWLPGTVLLPELIRANRPAYVAALKVADQTGDISQLHALLKQLLEQQIASATPPQGPPPRRLNRRVVRARELARSTQ